MLLVAWALSGCTKPPDRPAASPESLPGTVVITSEPTRAAVFQNQYDRLGTTPMTLTRPDGTALRLELVKEGRARLPILVMVEGGRRKTVHHELLPAEANVVVSAGPIRGANILMDGQRVGRTPENVPVEADKEHLLEVTMVGFHPYRERVQVAPGHTATVTAVLVPVNLEPRPVGWLTLESDAPAVVYLGADLLGTTPLTKLPLPPKHYTFRLESRAQGTSRTVEADVKPGEVTRLEVAMGARDRQGE